jgi:hypothetical protein
MGGQHLCDHKAAIAIYSFLRSGLVEIFYVSATFYMLAFFLKKMLLLMLLFTLTLKFQVHSGALVI